MYSIAVLCEEVTPYTISLIENVYNKMNHNVDVIFRNYRTSTHTWKIDINNKSYIILPHFKLKKIFMLIKKLKSKKYDFVIVNGYSNLCMMTAITFCIARKIPFSIETDTQLNIPTNPVKRFIKKEYLKFIFKHAYGFPGGTKQKELFRYYGMDEDKINLMPMTVDTEWFQSKSEILRKDKENIKKRLKINNQRVILFIGRLVKVKNLELLLDAFKKFDNRDNKNALVIVGEGEKADNLKTKCKNENISNVYFEGSKQLEEVVEYYAIADIFILPSYKEPWGLVINEALACGLPVIVSDSVGAAYDLVKHNENGFIFRNNNLEQLTKYIGIILSDENVRKDMSEKSKNIISTWNFTIYRRYLNDFLRSIFSNKNKGDKR